MCCAHPRACLQNPLPQLYNTAGLLRCLQVAGALMPNLLPGILATIQGGLLMEFNNNSQLALAQWTSCAPLLVGHAGAAAPLLVGHAGAAAPLKLGC